MTVWKRYSRTFIRATSSQDYAFKIILLYQIEDNDSCFVIMLACFDFHKKVLTQGLFVFWCADVQFTWSKFEQNCNIAHKSLPGKHGVTNEIVLSPWKKQKPVEVSKGRGSESFNSLSEKVKGWNKDLDVLQ